MNKIAQDQNRSSAKIIGYKLLTEDLASASSEHGRVTYSTDWQEIPGNGAYLGLTVPGLLRSGYACILAEIEGEEETGAVADGEVVTVRRARILRTARLDAWTLVRTAIHAARKVANQCQDPRVQATIAAAERCERERSRGCVRKRKAPGGMIPGARHIWNEKETT